MSLTLCVASVVLWIRSYCRAENLRWVDDIDDGTDVRYRQAPDSRRPAWARCMWHDEWAAASCFGVLTVFQNRSDVWGRNGAWLPKGWHAYSESTRTVF